MQRHRPPESRPRATAERLGEVFLAAHGEETPGKAIQADDPRIGSIGSLPSFTSGSVPFADSSGNLTEDPSGLSYDSANNRLSVGGEIRVGDGTQTVPSLSFSTHTDTGLYLSGIVTPGFTAVVDGDEKTSWSVDGFLVLNLTAGRFTFASTSGLLSDNAAFTYDLSGDTTFIASGDIRGGSATLQRFLWDYSDQSVSVYDSSGNQDVKIKANGDSWYNGSGSFGFGTTSPDAKVEITSSSADQLRLSYLDSTIYCDVLCPSTGVLTFFPTGNGMALYDAGLSSELYFHIWNLDSSSSNSHAKLKIYTSDDASGDATVEFATGTSAKYWSVGGDTSDSGTFKVSKGQALGTNDYLAIDTSGSTYLTNATTKQLRLGYDTSMYVDFTVLSSGSMQIAPSNNGLAHIAAIYNKNAVSTFALSQQNAGASAALSLTLASSGSGDTLISLNRGSATYYIGVDQSDSDAFKLSQTSLGFTDLWRTDSSGTVFNGYIRVSTATDAAAAGDFSAGATGGNRTFWDQSATLWDIIETSTGDPSTRWAVGTTTSFIAGIDNSDSDKWKLSYAASGSAVLGTSDCLSVDSSRVVNIPVRLTFGTEPTSHIYAAATTVHSGTNVYAEFGEGRALGDPSGTVTAALNGAGVLTGAYQYAYYETDFDGNATGLSPLSAVINPAAQQVRVTVPRGRPGVASRVLCRTKAGGSTFYVLQNFGTGMGFHQTVYDDNVADGSITVLASTVDSSMLYAMSIRKGVKFLATHPDQAGTPHDLTLVTGNPNATGEWAIDAYHTVVARNALGAGFYSIHAGTSSTHLQCDYVGDTYTDGVTTTNVLNIYPKGNIEMTPTLPATSAKYIQITGAANENLVTYINLIGVATATDPTFYKALTNIGANTFVGRYSDSLPQAGLFTNSGGMTYIGFNVDYDAGDEYSAATYPAARIGNADGNASNALYFHVAAPGSQGATITWLEALRIDNTRHTTASISDTATTPVLDLTQGSTGDAALRFALGSSRSYAFGIDNSDSDVLAFSTAASGSAVLGTSTLATVLSSGEWTFGSSRTVGGSLGRAVNIEGVTPGMTFYETDAAADEKGWDLFIAAGNLTLRTFNDAISAATSILEINRNGQPPDAITWNEGGVDLDYRIESDDEAWCFAVDGTLNNIVLCANTQPNFQTMDGGVFLAEANVVPTGNPTGGGYLYVEGGALKYRGTSGTVTTVGPA